MYCIKKALLTTKPQNSSRVRLYEQKTRIAYAKSLQKHTNSSLQWCGHLKSKFTCTTSNGKLSVLAEDSQRGGWHPLFGTDSSTLQENQQCCTAIPSTTDDQRLNWGECLTLISRELDHTEGGMHEVCFCSSLVQPFSTLHQACCSPRHRAERSPLLSTALVRPPVRTTQQGLVLKPRLQGFRKQRGSETSHIKTKGTGKQPWDLLSEELVLFGYCERRLDHCV